MGERAFQDHGGDICAGRATDLETDSSAVVKEYERATHIFIPGGADVDPQYYGEDPHPQLGFTSPHRDRLELTLTRWALEDNKPIFGICRGHQIITVAEGGTLYQDIPDQIPDALNHRSTNHPIEIAEDSQLAEILGTTQIIVNSLHHQAVKDVPPGWRAVAWAPDGVIEAIERDDRTAISVQFHPEMMYHYDERFSKLFDWFLKQGEA
jgi:putative glutamine amidotransferase